MRKIYMILVFFGFLLTSGCQTTTDPRSGGLFSYSPNAYKKRIEERETIKREQERQQVELTQRSKQLEEENVNKQSQQGDLSKKVYSLYEDIAVIEEKIAKAKPQTEEQQHAKWKIDVKLKVLKKQIAVTMARKKESKELRNEIDRLLKEAEALSN